MGIRFDCADVLSRAGVLFAVGFSCGCSSSTPASTDLRGADLRAVMASDGSVPGPSSYTLPFVDADSLSAGFRLRISAGQGPAHLVVMDTGSTGIVLPRSALGPGAQVESEPFKQEYSSSGITLTGHYATAVVRLGVPEDYDPAAPGSYATTVALRLGVAESVTCDPNYPDCTTDGDVDTVGMMGVGFDRDVATTPMAVNPFLQLTGIAEGAVHPGYVISLDPAQVILGMTPADTAGFQTLSLTPLAGYPGEWDGASLVGCVKLSQSAAFGTQCGQVLVDTGIAGGILTTPAALRPTSLATMDPGRLDSGVQVDVTIGKGTPLATYDYLVGSSEEKTPGYVDLRTSTDGTIHINTSRHLLDLYDYSFDAQAGTVGFRANP